MSMTVDYISRGDGQTNTLMLSENLNIRPFDPIDRLWGLDR